MNLIRIWARHWFVWMGVLWLSTLATAKAQEQLAYFAVSPGMVTQLSPETLHGANYRLEAGLNMSEQWWFVFAYELGFEPARYSRTGLGALFDARPYKTWSPTARIDLIYQYRPVNRLGGRLLLGMRTRLTALTGIDNLALHSGIGLTQLFQESATTETTWIEWLPFTLAWHF